jgi:hypothetical protein
MTSLSRIAAVCALSAAPLVLSASPGKAACVETVGQNTCAAFDPTSTTNVSSAGGFTMSVMSAEDVTRARVRLAVNGSWALPVTISGIKLEGPGINSGTPLSFDDITLSANNAYVDSNYLALDTPIMDWSWTNSRISFVIPANVANIPIGGNPVDWSSISARIQYSNTVGDSLNAPRVQFTARNPAPGPLPLMGAVSAFAFSRRLRQRVSQSA